MLKTHVLLITFNRPQHTKKVLKAILLAQPQDLYVFQDGFREGNDDDVIKCAEVRNVIDDLTKDTQTQLHTFYSEKNLGCGPGPAAAISWFFEKEEMGIIVEDDAVPHPDFFAYCEELLEKYKDETDVRAIGSMHLDSKTYGDGSYYFSMMNRTFCAWATWRCAWQDFDLYHRNVSRKQFNQCLKDYGCDLRMREYWCERLADVQKDAYHNSSWDQQFWMSIWLHHGKGIMPNVNLCTNIGFDAEATHTTDENSSAANLPTGSIMPMKHPSEKKIQHKSDMRFQRIYFDPQAYGWIGFKRLPSRWNKRLKRIVGHQGSWIKRR